MTEKAYLVANPESVSHDQAYVSLWGVVGVSRWNGAHCLPLLYWLLQNYNDVIRVNILLTVTSVQVTITVVLYIK